MLSHFTRVWLFVTPQTVARQAPLSMRFSRQECWSRLPSPPPGGLSNPGIKPTSFMSPALVGGFFTTSATWDTPKGSRKGMNKNRMILKDGIWIHLTVPIWGLYTVRLPFLTLQGGCESSLQTLSKSPKAKPKVCLFQSCVKTSPYLSVFAKGRLKHTHTHTHTHTEQ